jgi:hypothetical protein
MATNKAAGVQFTWGMSCRRTPKWHSLVLNICIDRYGSIFNVSLWWITFRMYVSWLKWEDHDEQPDTSIYLG